MLELQLDKVPIRVRERNHLEILDLAIWVVRRHWLGVGVSLLVGLVPVFLLHALWQEMLEEAFYSYFVLTIIEIPWATAILTLYLGQATFWQRVQIGKLARDLAGSLGQMIVYHVLFRGCCAMLVPLVAVPILWHKYVSEIILLERDPWRKMSRRSVSFHSNLLGQILGETLLDLCLGIGLFLLLHIGLSTVSSLWMDYWDAWSYDPASDEFWFRLTYSWEARLALWLVLGYFAVVRYLSYLDCRIRREGWEVELKLRTQGARLAREAW